MKRSRTLSLKSTRIVTLYGDLGRNISVNIFFRTFTVI